MGGWWFSDIQTSSESLSDLQFLQTRSCGFPCCL